MADETLLSCSEVLLFGRVLTDIQFVNSGTADPPGKGKGKGNNRFLGAQLNKNSRIARIYAFSFGGIFHELPSPVLFVVDGPGESVTDGNKPANHAARAPLDPGTTGVGAADFQFADDVVFWPYDKSDYSIRLDVMSGQFEQILLEVFNEHDLPMLAGGRVAGGRVAGGRVAGGRVAGGRVAGGRVSGGRVSGSGD